MEIFKKCNVCGKNHPANEVTTVRLKLSSGKMLTVDACTSCMKKGDIVRLYDTYADDYVYDNDMLVYIYKSDLSTMRVFLKDGTVAYTHSTNTPSSDKFKTVTDWNYDTDSRNVFPFAEAEADEKDLIEVIIPAGCDCDEHAVILCKDVEEHPDIWIRCSECEKWCHHSLVTNGVCCKCSHNALVFDDISLMSHRLFCNIKG